MASLFQTIGAAGYNSVSGGRRNGTAQETPRNLLDSAIDDARSQSSAAVGTAREYGDSAISASRTAGDNAVGAGKEAVGAARSYGNDAVSAGRSGVRAILDARPGIDAGIADMRGASSTAADYYRLAGDTALGLTPYIQGVAGAADDVRGSADALSPIADTLGGYGDQMWESGTKVTEQALATLGTGMGFINMDADVSPLVAEALQRYGEIDPNRWAASAAQDVQKSMDNAQGQMRRNLARQGVNPSSGSAQAQLQKLFQNSLAVAKAAAMTRARERGITEKASAFQSLLANNANTFLGTGGQLASIGASGQGAAVSAQRGAADVLNAQGGLYNAAGGLLDRAGSLQGTQGSLLNNVANGNANLANVYEAIGKLGLNYGTALNSAFDALSGRIQGAGNAVTGALGNLATTTQNAGNNLANTTLTAGRSLSAAQQDQANTTASTEGKRVSALSGSTGDYVRIIDNTDRAIQSRLAAGKDPIAT